MPAAKRLNVAFCSKNPFAFPANFCSIPPVHKSLHIWRYYGTRTQSWLYRMLRGLKQCRPVLLLRKHWLESDRLKEFPWPERDMRFLPQRPVLSKLAGKLDPCLRARTLNVLNSFDARFIRSLCHENHFDVIHIHFGWTACTFLGATADLGAPIVVSLYGHDLFEAKGKYQRRLQQLLRSPDLHVHVTSEALKTNAVKMGANPRNVFVVPVGIALDQFPSEEQIRRLRSDRRDAQRIRIVTVGRLIEFKAPQALPRVARRLLDEGLNFEWVMAGDGPLRREVERECERHGVSECFRLTGSIPFDKVRELLVMSDIMVHNAVVDERGGRESLGVSLMEGGACGLPVVSCRIGGIPEVVRAGETGYLVDSADHETMADRVARLVRDDELRAKMGRAAMSHVRQTFDSNRLAAQVEELYARIRP